MEKLELENALAAEPDKYIVCPAPDCGCYVEASSPGSKEWCLCPRCNFEFCSQCKGMYHYRQTTCAEAAALTVQWFEWLRDGKSKFARAAEEQQQRANSALAKATEEAQKRFEELRQDEAWKEANCRMCPHCNKVRGVGLMRCLPV